MTTIAMAEGFRVCQSFLGAKLHDAKDPGADLSAMLHQVVGSVFLLMQEYEPVWREPHGQQAGGPVRVPLRRGTGPDRGEPGPHAHRVSPGLPGTARGLGDGAGQRDPGRGAADSSTISGKGTGLSICPTSCGSASSPTSLAPTGRSRSSAATCCGRSRRFTWRRVASFVVETENMFSAQVEERIEQLCLCFENLKPYLAARWNQKQAPAQERQGGGRKSREMQKAELEAKQ